MPGLRNQYHESSVEHERGTSYIIDSAIIDNIYSNNYLCLYNPLLFGLAITGLVQLIASYMISDVVAIYSNHL